MQIEYSDYDWEVYLYFLTNDVEKYQKFLHNLKFNFVVDKKLHTPKLKYIHNNVPHADINPYGKLSVKLRANSMVLDQIKSVFQELLNFNKTVLKSNEDSQITAQSYHPVTEERCMYRLQWNPQYVGYELETHEARLIPDFTNYQIIEKQNV